MKSLIQLWREVASDLVTWCSASTLDDRSDSLYLSSMVDADLATIIQRVKHEGDSFLTITLPAFGKDFERCLAEGRVDPCAFPGFGRDRSGFPNFCKGFLGLVFDRYSGEVLQDPDPTAVFAIRQLTLLFSKIQLPCSPAREQAAIDQYLECEYEIHYKETTGESADKLGSDLRRIAYKVAADVFSKVDLVVYNGEVHPKHGPGSTADRLLGNQKYALLYWPERLESVFPYLDNVLPNPRYFEYLDAVDFVEPGREIPVKVTLVPKTLKTPRIIAQEPAAMQYMQQGIARELVNAIEDDRLLSHFIGFSDQEPNQLMAQKGSLDGSLATIDLSEASDRVSNQLVKSLFASWPHLGEAIQATRSTRADVPDRGIITLTKFASMGSALTFPIEGIIFFLIVLKGIESQLTHPLTMKFIRELRGKVRVYGDDIIVPTEYADSVIQALELYGFKVNRSKTFTTGNFRESCGREYFNGTDVSITKVRKRFASTRSCKEEIVSMFSLTNQFHMAGLWKAADYVKRSLERLNVPTPVCSTRSPALGVHSFCGVDTSQCRTDYYLHKPLVKAWTVTPQIPRNEIGEAWALSKFFLTRGAMPSADRKHLLYSGRPIAVDTKHRWVSA